RCRTGLSDLTRKSNTYYNHESLGERPRGFHYFHPFLSCKEEFAMHSFVYELARTPICPDRYARAGNLPDWFYEQVCDYAENTDLSQREQAIADLSRFLGPLCTRKGDRLDFAPSL